MKNQFKSAVKKTKGDMTLQEENDQLKTMVKQYELEFETILQEKLEEAYGELQDFFNEYIQSEYDLVQSLKNDIMKLRKQVLVNSNKMNLSEYDQIVSAVNRLSKIQSSGNDKDFDKTVQQFRIEIFELQKALGQIRYNDDKKFEQLEKEKQEALEKQKQVYDAIVKKMQDDKALLEYQVSVVSTNDTQKLINNMEEMRTRYEMSMKQLQYELQQRDNTTSDVQHKIQLRSRIQNDEQSKQGIITLKQLSTQISALSEQLEQSSTLTKQYSTENQLKESQQQVLILKIAHTEEINRLQQQVMQIQHDFIQSEQENSRLKEENIKMNVNASVFRNDFDTMCIRCNKTFQTLDDLRNHQTNCDVPIKFTCPLCNMSFINVQQFTIHMGSHIDRSNSMTGSFRLPTSCPKCNIVFPEPLQQLYEHQKFCTGVDAAAKFKCIQCNVAMPTDAALQAHLAMHLNGMIK